MQHEEEYVKPQPQQQQAEQPATTVAWYENRPPVLAWVANANAPAQPTQVTANPVQSTAVPVPADGTRKRTFCIALMALVGSILSLLAVAIMTMIVIDYIKDKDSDQSIVIKRYNIPNKEAMDKIMAGTIELDEYEDDEYELHGGFMQDYEEMFQGKDSFDELFHILPISEEEEKYYAQLEEEKKKSKLARKKKNEKKDKKEKADEKEEEEIVEKQETETSYKPKARRLLVR